VGRAGPGRALTAARAPDRSVPRESFAPFEPSEFTLLISDVGNRKTADWTLDTAIPLLRRAARGPVDQLVGGPDPFAAIQEAVRNTTSTRSSSRRCPSKPLKWLRRNHVHRVERLGVPVTAIVPRQKSIRDAVDDSDDVTRAMIIGGG
jgi:transposase